MFNRKEILKILVQPIMFFVLILCLCFGIAGVSLAAENPVGKIDKAIGSVYIQHPGEKKSSLAKAQDDIFPKDKIKTASKSKASLSFINGAVLDVGENTDLEIKEFYYRPADALSKSTFKMKLGRLRAFVSKFTNPESRFEIQTTTAVTGVVGTEELVINEETEKDGEVKDTTRTVCTIGRVQVGSIDPKITETVVLDAFQQVWVYEDEPPEEVLDVTMEELEELLQQVLISLEEEKRGEAILPEQAKRAKPAEKAPEEKLKPEEKPEEKPVEKVEEEKKPIEELKEGVDKEEKPEPTEPDILRGKPEIPEAVVPGPAAVEPEPEPFVPDLSTELESYIETGLPDPEDILDPDQYINQINNEVNEGQSLDRDLPSPPDPPEEN